MSLPNAYLRCESRPPRGAWALGLWKYSLAAIIVASAALDAMWLAPSPPPDAASAARAASAYRQALHLRCHAAHVRPHSMPDVIAPAVAPELPRLVADARASARRSDWPSALARCERALGLDGANVDALRVCAIASCNLRDRNRAHRYVGALAPSWRAMARQTCLRNGFDP